MALNLRAIFDKYRIPWRDKGPNCSQGHVNIACFQCGNDPSTHLTIDESGLGYYCFRNAKHSGRNLGFLFSKLKIPLKELGDYATTNTTTHSVNETAVSKDYSAFQYFTEAAVHFEALGYLGSRLFSSPVNACRKFNLRVTRDVARWVGRLIIPLTVGWTGRSMRDWLEPRYLAHTDESGFFFHSNNSSSVVLVEGALDAMRLATVTSQVDVVGKCGNRVSDTLLLHLQMRNYLSIYNLPDADVPFLQHHEEVRAISAHCTRATVKKLTLKGFGKDLAEMKEEAAREWVSQNLYRRA